MDRRAFTLATYRARPGQEEAFVEAWRRLAETFVGLPEPPIWGTLIRSRTDPAVFHSFGPWRDVEDVQAMRGHPAALEAFRQVAALCEAMSPGDYEVVEHVDVARRRAAVSEVSWPTHLECVEPILRVEDMAASVRYYCDVLGFENADWGNDDFTRVGREGRGIYLCRGAQGHAGAWVWIGVEDVRALHEAFLARGAVIRQAPTSYSWALEMRVEDPDGNVLRFGSDPEEDA